MTDPLEALPVRLAAHTDETRRALVAPDSFKGTIAAADVAAAIARGVRAAGSTAVELPVADGGEGTMDVLVRALGGELHTVVASDPLGRQVQASWALLTDGRTAVVEAAQASGLGLVGRTERGPATAWAASTRGTGELIAAAVAAGAERVLVTVGGSATTDGGAGALEALAEVDVGDVAIDVLCDVTTSFEQAPAVFAPQKGADASTVAQLERRLTALAATFARDPRDEPMTGAAGGLAGGLWAQHGARLVSGAAYVLDALGFDGLARSTTLVVTGEGRLDLQTRQGKIVGEIARRCRGIGVPCHAVVGRNKLAPHERDEIGIAAITEAGTIAALEAAGTALGRRGAG
ncbi:MAG: glycerate kinase [Actinobacteria bacterium]|nr:glycerate kinase [Actinomycetota bacterium]